MERIERLLQSEEPVTWVFYGDSITHGALHTEGWRDYVEIFAERVRYERGLTRQTIINSATSGDNTRGLLAGFEWRVAQFRPAVVPVMIGMNDCSSGNDISDREFEDNLRTLAGRIADLGAMTLMQTTSPILPGQAPDRSPHIGRFMDIIRAVAADLGLPLVDHARHWQEHADRLFYWMSDPFHPNAAGHRVLARHLCSCLDIWDEASPCGRQFIP